MTGPGSGWDGEYAELGAMFRENGASYLYARAAFGDSVGYWFGTKAGNAFLAREDSRFFKRAYIARTQKFFETYGGRAIILARFVPIVRPPRPPASWKVGP